MKLGACLIRAVNYVYAAESIEGVHYVSFIRLRPLLHHVGLWQATWTTSVVPAAKPAALAAR